MILYFVLILFWIASLTYENKQYKLKGDPKNKFWMGFATAGLISCASGLLSVIIK